jgi:hypothetical protein
MTTMRTTGLLAAIGVTLLLAASPAFAQGKDAAPAPAEPDINPAFNPGSTPRDTPTDRPSRPAEERTTPPAPVRWNSAAAAIWRHRGRVHVAVGYSGARNSADDARASALDACRNAGGSGCKAIGAWNNGCLYITTGTSSSRAGWGSGGSIDAALKKCRSYGFSCKQPIGGCVD